MQKELKKLLKSKEAQKELKIRACDIMHLRQNGRLRFERKGNAFLYYAEDIEDIKKNDKLKE